MPDQAIIVITRISGQPELRWHCELSGMIEFLRDVEGAPEAVVAILQSVIERIKPSAEKLH